MFEFAKHQYTKTLTGVTNVNTTITSASTAAAAAVASAVSGNSSVSGSSSNSTTTTTPTTTTTTTSITSPGANSGPHLRIRHPLLSSVIDTMTTSDAKSVHFSDRETADPAIIFSGVGGGYGSDGDTMVERDVNYPTAGITAPEFNPMYFSSELFKVTLVHPEGPEDQVPIRKSLVVPLSSPPSSSSSSKDVKDLDLSENLGPSVFYIHKALLASLSPELKKHTDNQMKEGLAGEMVLEEVDRKTMQRFLQWAYRGEYTVTLPPHSLPTTSLLSHIHIYVFGDRFNIPPLQNLSYNHIISLLPQLQLHPASSGTIPAHPTSTPIAVQHLLSDRGQHLLSDHDHLILLRALRYAADNLPSTSDRLMTQLIQTLAWSLESVSPLPEFAVVVHAQPEVAVAVCRAARGSVEPPWVQVDFRKPRAAVKEGGSSSKGGGEPKPRKSKCSKTTCGWIGFPSLQCRRCRVVWEDSRTAYPEHDWKFGRCRGCQIEESSASLREVCPICKEGEGLKWASSN